MRRGTEHGLTEHGFIANLSSRKNVHPQYESVLEDALESVVASFGAKVHSMYLYGSVARGTATPFSSDLDISVIMRSACTNEEELRFEEISDAVTSRHPIISKLEYDVGAYEEVLRPEERYHWQYWLKSASTNVWGQDITRDMLPHKPSMELALRLNGDLSRRLQSALTGLTEENVNPRAKAVAKKVLRSAYSLVAFRDNSWYTDIPSCARTFLRYYPHFSPEIARSLELVEKGADIKSLREFVEGFGMGVWRLFEEALTELGKVVVDGRLPPT